MSALLRLGVGALMGVALVSCVDEPVQRTLILPEPIPATVPSQRPVVDVGEVATVRDVHDGDTFTLTNGEKVRLFGYNSCELNTNAGPAARDALVAIMPPGTTVALRREPGVDIDNPRYGRHLRYVGAPGVPDVGEYMVRQTHSGVYEGRNDASPEYVARLRALDVDGRDCS